MHISQFQLALPPPPGLMLRIFPPCKSMGCGAFANFACISSLLIKHFFENEEMIVAVNAIYAIA